MDVFPVAADEVGDRVRGQLGEALEDEIEESLFGDFYPGLEESLVEPALRCGPDLLDRCRQGETGWKQKEHLQLNSQE